MKTAIHNGYSWGLVDVRYGKDDISGRMRLGLPKVMKFQSLYIQVQGYDVIKNKLDSEVTVPDWVWELEPATADLREHGTVCVVSRHYTDTPERNWLLGQSRRTIICEASINNTRIVLLRILSTAGVHFRVDITRADDDYSNVANFCVTHDKNKAFSVYNSLKQASVKAEFVDIYDVPVII